MSAQAFIAALDHVLKYEGGWADHPLDPGGATNFGVTQATYDAWRRGRGEPTRSVRDITRAEVETIYHDNYWLRAGCQDIAPPALALCVFDAAVNSGVGAALEWLRQTRDWPTYQALRLEFLANLSHWPTFGKGWARRIAALTKAAAELDAPEKLLLVFDGQNNEVARVPFTDLLLRVRGSRVYVRPE